MPEAGLDHHLRREFHAGASLVEPAVKLFCEPAQAAIDIMDRRAEPDSRHGREHGISPPPVQERHGRFFDAAPARRQPAAKHERVAGAQLFHKPAQIAEVVTVVRIPHDDECPARRLDAAHQRRPVAFFRDIHDTRAAVEGYLPGAVGAAVVGQDHLPGNLVVTEPLHGFPHANAHAVRLVQAWNDNREFARSRQPGVLNPRAGG